MTINAIDVPTRLPGLLPAEAPKPGAGSTQSVEPIFSDPENQGVDPTGDVTPVGVHEDPDASPEQVAAHVKWQGAAPDEGQGAFMEAIHAHGDDPEWLAAFYAELGPEKAGQLIAQTTDPLAHSHVGVSGGDPEIAQLQTQAVLDSLQTMHDAGYLDGQSLESLLGGLHGDSIIYAATEIFGNADSGLKELFFNFAAQSDSPDWNAGALHVLNTLSSDRQQALLTSLGDGLDGFIANAMAGEREIASFANAVAAGGSVHMLLEQGVIDPVTYGGIDTLLETANSVTVYYHAKTTVPDFDSGLQADLFSAVTTALANDELFDQFIDNASVKEELSTLFINNSDDLLHAYAPDGAFLPGTIEGLTSFFELTLFTHNPGGNREQLMEHVLMDMSDVDGAMAAPPLPQGEYEAEHGGWSQYDHVEVMGGMQAMVMQAAENQQSYLESEILSDQKQREEMIGFITGMAFAFVPGSSTLLKGLSEQGGDWLSKVPETIGGYVYDQASSQLQEGSQDVLLDLLSGAGDNQESLADVTAFMDMFRDTVLATNAALPNGEDGELDLRSSFQSAYAFYRDLVSF